MHTQGFVDLSGLPDFVGEVKEGTLISALRFDGSWEPMILESFTPEDKLGFSTWKARLLWITPTWAHKLENASMKINDDTILRQYRVEMKDIECAHRVKTSLRTIQVRINGNQISSPSYVRIISGVGYHQRTAGTMDQWLHPLGLPLNKKIVRGEEWFHGTFKENWLDGVESCSQKLMVHMGTEFAAGERIYDIGKNHRIKRGTDFYIYRMRLHPQARVCNHLISDANKWEPHWDANYHKDTDAFVYVNNYEQRGSSSLYVRGDMMELISMDIHQFYPEGLRYIRDAGRSLSGQALNTSRIRADQGTYTYA